eukprot:TRINITY_DN18274_c0_g1_i1.p1 TRINITY_DN18274_c0_g1~~TRINITY_DN18274_c0_g1_i1.p1  ORF type:complete len:1119 (+),score=407.75 TRINITY_DN18274_c0_g1_i1:79-3435(+)
MSLGGLGEFGAGLGAGVDVAQGALCLPPPWMLGGCGAGMCGGLSMFLWDFARKRRQGREKRQRVFARTVRAYLAEFDAELREQTKAQRAGTRTASHGNLTLKLQTSEPRVPETTDREAVMGPRFVSFSLTDRNASGAYSASQYGDEALPFVMTHSFCQNMQARLAGTPSCDEGGESALGSHEVSEAKYGFKTIFLLGIEPDPKKLVVRRGAPEADVRAAVLRLFRLQDGQPVSFTSTLDDAPVECTYDSLVDGGVYRVRHEVNVRRRRITMIAQGADHHGGFRYSVGVDWREVFNMLRKAVQYGETEPVQLQLHGLLARNLIERLDAFYDDPDKEAYQLGKALDHIARDLRQLSEITSLPPHRVLQLWRPDATPDGKAPAAAELVRHFQQQLRQRSQEGWQDLGRLLCQSYLKREHLLANAQSWAMSCSVGMLAPHVHALQCRLAREIGEARVAADLPRVGVVLFWTLAATVGMNVVQQVSRQNHIRQTATALQQLRKRAAALLARADQAFFDTHDVEDILATLETDIGNIELLLRFSRGWVVDLCHIFVSFKMIVTAMLNASPGGALGIAAGAAACGAVAGAIRWVKTALSEALTYIPEEEDDVQEFVRGARVTYTGGRTKADITLANGVVLEAGDVGEVLAAGAGGGGTHACKFAAGEVDLHESDLCLTDGVACGAVGGPEPDYDEVWDPETFSVARQWGRDVGEVELALAVRDLQIEQQNKFILVPAVLQDVMEACFDAVPKCAMLAAALLVLRRVEGAAEGGGAVALGVTLLFLQDEAETAVTLVSKMRTEVRSLVKDCFAGARRTLHLLAYRPTIDQPDPAKIAPPPAAIAGRLEFRNVAFSYPSLPGKAVLCGLSFAVDAGAHVAVVGPSGCGKSTLMALLTRLYDPAGGAVLLDDRPLQEYDVRHLRKAVIGVAVQDPYLYPGTLQYNVKYANPDADREAVQSALATAAADHIVSRLPEKLLSVVGPGLKLSGGEQKRIGLARALLAAPRVLVLDEPTAGVDAATEAVIKRNLDDYRRRTRCSVLTSSHQIAFIQDCDRIIVLGDPDVDADKGRVVAAGTHDHLLKTCPQYQKIVNAAHIRRAASDRESVMTTSDMSPTHSPSAMSIGGIS